MFLYIFRVGKNSTKGFVKWIFNAQVEEFPEVEKELGNVIQTFKVTIEWYSIFMEFLNVLFRFIYQIQ